MRVYAEHVAVVGLFVITLAMWAMVGLFLTDSDDWDKVWPPLVGCALIAVLLTAACWAAVS